MLINGVFHILRSVFTGDTRNLAVFLLLLSPTPVVWPASGDVLSSISIKVFSPDSKPQPGARIIIHPVRIRADGYTIALPPVESITGPDGYLKIDNSHLTGSSINNKATIGSVFTKIKLDIYIEGPGIAASNMTRYLTRNQPHQSVVSYLSPHKSTTVVPRAQPGKYPAVSIRVIDTVTEHEISHANIGLAKPIRLTRVTTMHSCKPGLVLYEEHHNISDGVLKTTAPFKIYDMPKTMCIKVWREGCGTQFYEEEIFPGKSNEYVVFLTCERRMILELEHKPKNNHHYEWEKRDKPYSWER